jgi:hypothetical protein
MKSIPDIRGFTAEHLDHAHLQFGTRRDLGVHLARSGNRGEGGQHQRHREMMLKKSSHEHTSTKKSGVCTFMPGGQFGHSKD